MRRALQFRLPAPETEVDRELLGSVSFRRGSGRFPRLCSREGRRRSTGKGASSPFACVGLWNEMVETKVPLEPRPWMRTADAGTLLRGSVLPSPQITDSSGIACMQGQ